MLEKAAQALNDRGFKARVFSTAEEAKAAVLELIGPGESVGVGGSMTIHDMGLHTALMDRGNAVYWHWLTPDTRAQTLASAAHADVYLSSSNAVTLKGDLVNIDGTGNRVAGMFYGPAKVVIVAGRNKVVSNNSAAMKRIRREACPKNARRLKLETPCAVTGKCTRCKSPQRMCRVTVRIAYPPAGREIYVYLVDEDLGY